MYQFLVSEFEKLNENVPNIHYGGCCVFAEELHQFLVRMGKKPQIIVMTNWPIEFDASVTLRQLYSGIFEVRHAVILVDGLLIDNNGVYKTTKEIMHCEDSYYSCVDVTIDELQWVNREVRGWNTSFNRNQIKDIVEALENIEKSLVESN